MFECYIQCYPWDLLDEGIDPVLDRLQDQVGITGLTLLVVCDQMEQFRPHLGAQPKIHRSSGGVFFQPDSSRYQATRLKPPIWEQRRKRDVVAKVAECCAARQLDMRLSISPFHSHRLVAKHPEVACKNAYEVSSRYAMCPNNPDVRGYLLSLARDLSVYDDVSAVQIDEVRWPAATDQHARTDAMRMFDNSVSQLLNICFCESCLQVAADANVDGQAAFRTAETLLNRICQQGRAVGSSKVLHDSISLSRYVDWRASVLLDLLKQVNQAAHKSFVLNLQDEVQEVSDLPGVCDLIELADKVVVDFHGLEEIVTNLASGDEPEGVITPAPANQMELLWRVNDGMVQDAPELVRQISWASEAGASGMTVSHYGAILENQFDWIRQGLRNARRLAETR